MSAFNPVNAYKYKDPCGNMVPITNSNFVYGTLTGGNWNSNYTAKGNDYGSLSVASLYGNTNLVTTIDATNTNSFGLYNKVIQVLIHGIYRLKTTLSFSGSGFGSGNNQDFGFFIDDAIRRDTAMDTILSIVPYQIPDTNHTILSLGYIYSNNGANYSINSSNQPYVVLTNKATSSSYNLVNNGISVIETILYLHVNTPLYFNISSRTTGNGINATGNFMLELLHANYDIVSGEKYFYNNYNKLNQTFVMFLLENGQNVQNSSNTYYTAYNNLYNALKVGSNVGNSNLIGIPSVSGNNTAPFFYVNNPGIYRIRTTLIFSGSGFSNNGAVVNPVWNIQNLQFMLFYSSTRNNNNNTLDILVDTTSNLNSSSQSKILSVGYLYSNDGPNYEIDAGVLTVNLPCRGKSSTTLVNNGISVVELIVFLKKENYVSFNIRPGSGTNGNYITAQGNCTLELLAHTDSL